MATDEELDALYDAATGELRHATGSGLSVLMEDIRQGHRAAIRAVYNAGLARAAEIAERLAKDRMRLERYGTDGWFVAQNLSVEIPAAIEAEKRQQ